jgi:hypothetical protein
MSQLNRRNALALVATLPTLAATPAAVAAMDSPDAELIGLGREFDRLALVLNDCFRRSDAAHDEATAMMMEDAAPQGRGQGGRDSRADGQRCG